MLFVGPFFFFQAEDGIRDVAVTGVQTCALPISRPRLEELPGNGDRSNDSGALPVVGPRRQPWKPGCGLAETAALGLAGKKIDRKSTRLNSSHGYISYAVFCLKKKKKKKRTIKTDMT